MSKTVAIYQETPSVMLRVGTFTRPKGCGPSVREVSNAWRAEHPGAKDGKFFITARVLLMGVWSDDSQRIPMEPAQ